MLWKTFDGQSLRGNIPQIIEDAILRESKDGYKVKVCVGTDSRVKMSRINFASVVVVLREINGGYMFFNRSSIHRNNLTMKERLIIEVGKSVQIAYELNDVLMKYDVPLEVHADINQDEAFPSYTAVKEALGYIKGMGFDFKLKPDAFASSSCADRLV